MMGLFSPCLSLVDSPNFGGVDASVHIRLLPARCEMQYLDSRKQELLLCHGSRINMTMAGKSSCGVPIPG